MIAALVVAILALALVVLVARPLLAPTSRGLAAPQEQTREVDAQVADALAAIEEIEFDRASGHLSEEDFAALSTDAKRRAVELIRRRDAERQDGD